MRNVPVSHYSHKIEIKVRDYECDLQGIVNNAVYHHYLEHARHEFLNTVGINFSSLSERGVDLVLTRAEIDYKFPLRSGDCFWVGTNAIQVSKLRFGFLQDIYRLKDDKLILQAKMTGTSLSKDGKPIPLKELEDLAL
ncbi:MAG: acyl-CoA thioesterase [Candidatus Omnitrophica bacterium]|nr:acyl-CoA thioesterase [Candidatus Omnitrophota bacterium]